jgi:hypothetical protein
MIEPLFANGWLDSFRSAFGPPLRRIQAPIDAWLASLPLWVAQASVLVILLLTALLVTRLHRRYVYIGAPDERPWRDLRVWSLLLLVPYFVIYVILGR